MSLRNTAFQYWWSLTKPPRAKGPLPEDDAAWMFRQFQTADMFGGAQQVFIGDSNAASMSPARRMSRLSRLTVNIGRPGSNFVHWAKFLASAQGQAIRQRIGALPVVINLGGNHCWTPEAMTGFEPAAETVRIAFPGSWIFNVPPVSPSFLKLFHESAPDNIIAINRTISRLWRGRVLDVHGLFSQTEWADMYSVLATDDFVHYSEQADRHRAGMINAIPWGIP